MKEWVLGFLGLSRVPPFWGPVWRYRWLRVDFRVLGWRRVWKYWLHDALGPHIGGFLHWLEDY